MSRIGTRGKSGGFGYGRLPDKPSAIGFQVSLDRGDASQTDRNTFLTLEKAVVRERFSHFHDFDVPVVHLPKLAFGKGNGRYFLRLDSFRCRRTFYHCKVHFHTLIAIRRSASILRDSLFQLKHLSLKQKIPQNTNRIFFYLAGSG
jgi:hypothetical protein